MKAIGVLETKGLIGNIEGLDAMMKAARVDYVGGLTLGSGLVAMVVTGEVDAVEAAVEAGCSAAVKAGELFCHLVIPGPTGSSTSVCPSGGLRRGATPSPTWWRTSP